MESTIYKQGEAAGERKGERKLIQLQLEEKLGSAAGPFVARLETCSPTQIEALARLVVKTPDADLPAALEAVFADA